MCDHRGPFDGDLPCVRTDPHPAATGHQYEASWAADVTHDDVTGDF